MHVLVHSFFHSLIHHSFNIHLLSCLSVSGTVVGAKKILKNEIFDCAPPNEIYQGRKTLNTFLGLGM